MPRRNPERTPAGEAAHPAMSEEVLEAVARRFRALSTPSRLRILNALMGGPLAMGALVARSGLEQSNLSRQVGELEQEGLVRRTRTGRRVTVEIVDASLFTLCEVVCGALEAQAEADRARFV